MVAISERIKKKTIPLRSWAKIRNNGDAISSFIISKLLNGIPYNAKENEPHLLAVGSTFFMANSMSTIWGTGILNRDSHLPKISASQIKALRGFRTADILVQNGVHVGDVPFGDPGIFAIDLLKANKKLPLIRYRIGLVPHHNSVNHPFYVEAAKREDVCLINILDNTLKPLEEIAQCEIVLSQSLHGLIYAESLGIPSLWIGDRADDTWNFKFEDWFSTVYNPQKEIVIFNNNVEELVRHAELHFSKIDKNSLLDSFPFAVCAEEKSIKVEFEVCRAQSPICFFFQHGENVVDLEIISSIISEVLSVIFTGWAERTYCIAAKVSAGVQFPTSAQSQIIISEMDKRSYMDYGIIIDKLFTLPEGVLQIALDNGVVIYKNLKVTSNIFVLRPSHDRLTDNFLVFGI